MSQVGQVGHAPLKMPFPLDLIFWGAPERSHQGRSGPVSRFFCHVAVVHSVLVIVSHIERGGHDQSRARADACE